MEAKETSSLAVLRGIALGTFDDKLEEITTAAVHRRRELQRQRSVVAMVEFQVGDKVKLRNLRPKHVNGKVVEIVAKRQTKLTVKYVNREDGIDRFGMLPFNVPAGCVEAI